MGYDMLLFMKNSIQLCMFDMGGVLALHSDVTMEGKLLKDFGLSGYSSFSDLDPTLPALLMEHSMGKITEDEMWHQFTLKTKVSVPAHTDSLWCRYFQPELNDIVLSLIQELKEKGFRVVCATNTEQAHYEYHRRHGQYDVFDAVYTSIALQKAKPDPAFFEKILQAEHMQANDVFFCDDYPENCEAASALGINAVLYTDPVDLRWKLADMEIL